MRMRILKQVPLLLSVCCILFIGCHTGNTADDLLSSKLQQEISKFREDIGHDIHDDFVSKRISSMETSFVLVHVRIDDLDTLLEICVFDTAAPCNRGMGDFSYRDCLTVSDEGGKIFISDEYQNVFHTGHLLSKEEKTMVEFTDGIFRYYYYQDGNLIQFSPPLPSYEATVVLDDI